MDLEAIIKLLKDNPKILESLLPVLKPIIKDVLNSALDRLVNGILEKI